MNKEMRIDLNNLIKVKKEKISMTLDEDIIKFFKDEYPGVAISFLINAVLRTALNDAKGKR